MQLDKILLPSTHAFSSFFLDYISGKDALKPFYHRFPEAENFGDQIKEKSSFPQSNRKILVDTLTRQYKSLKTPLQVQTNIDLLASPDTFTITTGHQLNIFTGPLYFIYKIVTVVNTCKRLRAMYPGKNFVPVYWMASEDHDFEEISNFRLYGKKYQWSTNQTGAVGKFNPKELEKILNEIPGEAGIFKEAYLKHRTLSDAVRFYVTQLFSAEGVVVIDADDRALKDQLKPVIEDDLFAHNVHALVDEQTEKLKALGYHTQVNSREINFFYLKDSIRDRIESGGDGFAVVNQNIKFTANEIRDLVQHSPEVFSPNVILRPLYQEIILPNLAYVGGPSEVVYWLQLKGVFEHFKIPFPILMPRNFAMVMDHTVVRKFEKTGLELKDLFEDKNYLFNHWTIKNTNHQLTLSDAIRDVDRIFEEIRVQSETVDATLGIFTAAKKQQTVNHLQKIEEKILRAEKRRHADKLQQIEALKDSLFPKGSLQERTDNFLNFYQQNPEFLKELIDAFDPFDYRMHVLMYNA